MLIQNNSLINRIDLWDYCNYFVNTCMINDMLRSYLL